MMWVRHQQRAAGAPHSVAVAARQCQLGLGPGSGRETEDRKYEEEMDAGDQHNRDEDGTNGGGQAQEAPMISRVVVLGEAGPSCDAADNEGNSPAYQIVLPQFCLIFLNFDHVLPLSSDHHQQH